MHISLDSVVLWVTHYKYAVVFPLAFLEGPIITIITGFLTSLGVMNFWIAYAVIVAGDLLGDCFFYFIGRFGRTGLIYRYGKYIGLHPEKLEVLEAIIRKNTNKILIFGKFAHGTGSVLWVGTGLSKVPFPKFVAANFVTTCIKSFILIIVGYYFGQAYQTFNMYFRNISLFFLVALIILYFIFIRTKIQEKLS